MPPASPVITVLRVEDAISATVNQMELKRERRSTLPGSAFQSEEGLEPSTSPLRKGRSIQLSYTVSSGDSRSEEYEGAQPDFQDPIVTHLRSVGIGRDAGDDHHDPRRRRARADGAHGACYLCQRKQGASRARRRAECGRRRMSAIVAADYPTDIRTCCTCARGREASQTQWCFHRQA